MRSFLHATIYHLSGTGNSYRVARWMGREAEVRNIHSRVIAIEEADPERELVASRHQLAVLVFPTHGFTAPWRMIRFAFGLPPGGGAAAFCVATRGALRFGPVTVPGAAGTAALLISLILRAKGYDLRGITALDLPSNWMSLYSGFSPEDAPPRITRARIRAGRIFTRVLDGGRYWYSLSNAWDLLIWGLPLLWFSALYLLVGRFFLAKLFFAGHGCAGCGQCAEHCPTGSIIMLGKRNPRPYWKYDCESCMRCMAYCPNRAVEAGHSWGVILYFVTTLPAGVWFFSWLTARHPGASALQGWFSILLVNLVYFYLSLFLAYFVFHWLIRIRLANLFFTFTTFTHLYPRYHEPDTRPEDLGRRPTGGDDAE